MNSSFRQSVRSVIGAAALMVPISAAILAQTPAPAPAQPRLEFESASVKIHPMAPGTYLIKNFPHKPPFVIPTSNTFAETAHAQDLVMEAYGISEYQILYLPAWALSGRGLVYDIEAKMKGDIPPTPAAFQQMLQSLLADRFHLKTHWETKPKFSVYALVVDKGGPKFREFHKTEPAADGPAPAGGPPFAGTTLFALARFLTQTLHQPVVDRTDLPAVACDFNIDNLVDYHEINREEDGPDPLAAQDYLFSSVQHQLGLRMDSRKESTQLLVIDHIDEPSQD